MPAKINLDEAARKLLIASVSDPSLTLTQIGEILASCLKRERPVSPASIGRMCKSLGIRQLFLHATQPCSVSGCLNLHNSPTGLCYKHQRQRQKSAPDIRENYRLRNREWKERRRQDITAPRCQYPGCQRAVMCKGYCGSHYATFYHPKEIDKAKAICREYHVAYCIACGYERLIPHLHRIDKRGEYTPKNTVPLCPNCHLEVHRSILDLAPFLLRYSQSTSPKVSPVPEGTGKDKPPALAGGG